MKVNNSRGIVKKWNLCDYFRIMQRYSNQTLPMARKAVSNADIATMLERIADLLDARGENPFRIRSYRFAATAVRGEKARIAGLVAAQGPDALRGIRGIGEKIAGLIREYVEKGSVDILGTLEKEVPQDGSKKPAVKKTTHDFKKQIDIPLGLVLEIDNEYRTKAAAGKLKMIAPRQFNPGRKAWLPLLAKESGGYRFTVMYSNTETAHRLGKTNDWVVVYFEKKGGENQCTVVTESRGKLKGRRVIRGRETECAEYYEGRGASRRS